MLAAELALGVLVGEERVDALRRKMADPGFARAVENWTARLHPLHDETPVVAPPAHVWPKIEAALGSVGGAPAVLTLRLRRWRAAALLSSAVAASLALALVLRPAPAVPTSVPTLVAQLGPSDAQAALLARYDERSGEMVITPATLAVSGHSAELWIIPVGQKPRSLGLVNAAGATRLLLSADARLGPRQGATFAVSVEPLGGSPTGQPTGPVIASGKFFAI